MIDPSIKTEWRENVRDLLSDYSDDELLGELARRGRWVLEQRGDTP